MQIIGFFPETTLFAMVDNPGRDLFFIMRKAGSYMTRLLGWQIDPAVKILSENQCWFFGNTDFRGKIGKKERNATLSPEKLVFILMIDK